MTFSELVNTLMNSKKYTYAKLSAESFIPERTLGRIKRNSNGRNGKFVPQLNQVCALALAFDLDAEEFNIFVNLAFPQLQYTLELIQDGKSTQELCDFCQKYNLPLMFQEKSEK